MSYRTTRAILTKASLPAGTGRKQRMTPMEKVLRPDPTPEPAANCTLMYSDVQKSAPVSPLFKADTATLTFAATKDGKVRITFHGWDDAKVVLPGQFFELCLGPQGVEGRIVNR